MEEDDEEEVVKVINASKSPLHVRLTRDGRQSRSNQKCSLSGVSCTLSYDSASDMKNRRFCSAHFAASSELRKNPIVSDNEWLHRIFTIDIQQRRG